MRVRKIHLDERLSGPHCPWNLWAVRINSKNTSQNEKEHKRRQAESGQDFQQEGFVLDLKACLDAAFEDPPLVCKHL